MAGPPAEVLGTAPGQMGEVWHDNRLGRREDLLDILVIASSLGTLAACGIGILVFYLGEGGSHSLAALFAGMMVLVIVFFVVLGFLMKRERAVAVSFSDQGLAWRTGAGGLRSAEYDRVIEILPWPRWAAVPRRYVVLLRADRIPPREGLWLSPENRVRFEDALRRTRRRG